MTLSDYAHQMSSTSDYFAIYGLAELGGWAIHPYINNVRDFAKKASGAYYMTVAYKFQHANQNAGEHFEEGDTLNLWWINSFANTLQKTSDFIMKNAQNLTLSLITLAATAMAAI